MEISKKYQLAKQYNFIQEISMQDYVDAKDTVNHWCVGSIEDIDQEKNMYKIHFEGWSNRYDEWMKKNSQRLAPFRRHTEGYSGQKKSAYRDFKINYSYHGFMLKQVKDLTNSNFQSIDNAYKLTQFVRGEFYFYVDSLISLFTNTTNEDIIAITEFIQEVFKLIIKWMQIFPKYLENFNENKNHPLLYLVDQDTAISQLGNELFSIFEKCFGLCQRCNKFLSRFSSEYLIDGEFASQDKIRNNGLMLSFLNGFGQLQGFREIIDFITFTQKDNKGQEIPACPLILTMKALRPFVSILDFAQKAFVQQFVEQVKKALNDRLDNLTENEIKVIDKEIIKDTIEVLKNYINILQPQETYKIAELKELNIAKKFLKSPYFEKKVRGLNDLKEIFYKVQSGVSRSKSQLDSQNIDYARWLNYERYANWLIQEQIIEYIFNEFLHVELIKRSQEILKLLASSEPTFSPQIIELLWSCCKDKHEDIVRATLLQIQDLAQILPLERLQLLFTKINTIKEQEYDEKLVSFLKNYTLNTIKNLRSQKKQEAKQSGYMNFIKKKEGKIDESLYYDLSKFWLIFQDHNKGNNKVKDISLNSLIEIIQEINDKDIKEQFVFQSIENIKRGETFIHSLIFLKKVLNTYPLESQVKFKPNQTVYTVQNMLTDISKKVDLFDIILMNVDKYIMKQQKQAINNQQHEEYMNVIFSFIEFVIINSKITLSYDNVELMYKLFVQNQITDLETNQFFLLLTKENEQAKQRKFLLDDKVRNEVFQKIFCNNQFTQRLNICGFNCFTKLFIIVNQEQDSLQLQKDDSVQVNNLNNLFGIETLWPISIQSTDKEVRESCRDFLVDLYLKAKTKNNQQKKTIIEHFINKCLKYFQSNLNDNQQQLNCLKLIRTFINRFDGDHIIEEDINQYNEKENKIITITLHPEKMQTTLKININQKLWQLKRKMANHFKMRLSEFYIKTKQGPLEEASYNEPIKEYQISQIHIQRIAQEDMENEFPRYLIGYNSDYLKTFIEMLYSGNEVSRNEVISLFQILPINIEIKDFLKEHIQKISTSDYNQQTWNQIMKINSQDLSKTLYFLMALEHMMIPRKDIINQEIHQQEKQQKYEFNKSFIDRFGFIYLCQIFQQQDKQNLDQDILKTKALTIILKLLCYLYQLKMFPQIKQQLNQSNIENLIKETLKLIDSFLKTVLFQQNQQILNNRKLSEEEQIIRSAFNLLIKLISNNQLCINTLYQYSGIDMLLRVSLIEIETQSIQKIVQLSLSDLITQIEQNQTNQIKPSFFFMKQFINNCLDYALERGGNKTKLFFELINDIQTNTEIHSSMQQIKSVIELVKYLCNIIQKRQITELSARQEDVSLSGIFNMLRNILIKFPDIRQQFQEKGVILKYLIHECLFNKESKSNMTQKQKPQYPVCKNSNTRENCLKLLNILTINNSEGIQILIRYLKNYISETFWRTNRKSDWYITVHQQERSLTGFVGLKNIGFICYMNSIMQQLFMIPAFRKSLLEVEDLISDSLDENPLYQMKMIFGGLMEVEKQYYNPKRFCQAFKDIDGSPIDPMVQRDVDEFLNMLIDRIENLIKGKKEEKMIKNLLQGVYANEFICKGCPHYSEREEPFMAISLSVKNKHSIKESLESFVEGEMLDGDNAYYCEKCEKKVNTLKRCCIKRMPNILFLVLKRFEFNFDTMSKFKVNDYCEFPMQLNMQQYSQEYLTKQDLIKQMEDKNLTLDDLNEEQHHILDKNMPPNYYEYNLKGIVIHLGTADQGHYYSFIQDRESPTTKWYEFNDTLIKDFETNDIPYEAFGGEDENLVRDLQRNDDPQIAQAIKQFKTKIKNAYILIYEREDFIEMEKFNEFMDDPNIYLQMNNMKGKFEQCKLAKTISSQIQIPPIIHDSILEKNKKFWLSKYIFNRTFIDSILNIFKDIKVDESLNYEDARKQDLQKLQGNQFEMFRFLTTFFLTTVIRAKERKSVPYFMKIIREALQKNVYLCVWLIETFSNQDIIKEFLIDCPIPDMKRFVGGLIKTSMNTIYKFEEKALKEYNNVIDGDVLQYIKGSQQEYIQKISIVDGRNQQKNEIQINSSCSQVPLITITHHNQNIPILVIMINSMLHQSVSPHNSKYLVMSCQFYQVFSYFAELGSQARLYLLKNKCLGRLLDILFNSEKQIYRNESLSSIPLFYIKKNLFLDTNIKRNVVMISDQEKKQIYQQQTNYAMFLIYTISKLVRSCSFIKLQKNPYQNDELNFCPEMEDIQLIINHSHDMWWSNCQNKVTRNAIADMYSHMSFENKEFSLQYLQTLMKMYNASTYDQLKRYERLILSLFKIQDTYQNDRIKKGINELFNIMKNNIQYYKYTDSLIEFIYKCIQRCPQFGEAMNRNNAYLRQIDQWTKEYPHFPLNQQKTKIFKHGFVQWNNQKNLINQTILDRITQYSKQRLQNIVKLLQQKDTTSSEINYDSDDDMYKHNFQEKEKIDFSDTQDNWQTGYIDICLEEMVKCVSETNLTNNNTPITYWIEIESDKICQAFSQQGSEKNKLNGFYLTLLQQVQR